MTSTNRRYDIDWLRVIAIGLLLIYHIAIGFQPWGVFIGFIQNGDSIVSLWTPMSMLNIWRIPLLFFVSGMGVSFAIKRRDWKALWGERTRRILLPFLFGMFTIAPLHMLLWQDYYHQDLSYTFFNPGHLWFLGNIFLYVLLLTPIFFYLKNIQEGKWHKYLNKVFSHPLSLLLVIVPFIIEAEMVRPESFEMYAMTWHGFYLGLLAFFFGFLFVYSGDGFWKMLVKWRFLLLTFALGIYFYRLMYFDLRSPDYLMAIESCIWIYTVLAFGNKHLNKNSTILAYLSQAAYPVYILHMIFLYLASWWLFPLEIHPLLKFTASILITAVGCLVTYEYLVKRVPFLRPLFGLKPLVKKSRFAPAFLIRGVDN